VVQEGKRTAQPWFDRKCYEARRELQRVAWGMLRGDTEEERLGVMERGYREQLRSAKKAYFEKKEWKLIDEAARQPYKWIRKGGGRNACAISAEELAQYLLHRQLEYLDETSGRSGVPSSARAAK